MKVKEFAKRLERQSFENEHGCEVDTITRQENYSGKVDGHQIPNGIETSFFPFALPV